MPQQNASVPGPSHDGLPDGGMVIRAKVCGTPVDPLPGMKSCRSSLDGGKVSSSVPGTESA